MKKIVLGVMAVAALTFTACGNKAQQNKEVADSTATAETVDSTTTGNNELVKMLNDKLNTGDPAAFQQAIAQAKTQLAEYIKLHPEQAKTFIAQVQSYLKENKQRITELTKSSNQTVVSNVNKAVSQLTTVTPEQVATSLKNAVTNTATDAVNSAVNAAK